MLSAQIGERLKAMAVLVRFGFHFWVNLMTLMVCLIRLTLAIVLGAFWPLSAYTLG